MGGCFSIQLSGEDLNGILRFFCGNGYIRNLRDNLEDLGREMLDLKATQQELKNKVEREEVQHRQRLEAVNVWLNRVEKTDTEFIELRSTSHVHLDQELCLCDLCSINMCSSYGYGKRVFLLLEEVKKLKQEGKFEEVSELTQISVVEERPTQPTIGQEKLLETAWNRLMEAGVGIMGLHGMGGVGKTTLFKKIHNKLSEIDDSFDVVMWVVVSHGVTISKLQEDIAKKLHLWSDDWVKKNESDKAAEIYKFLNESDKAADDLTRSAAEFPDMKNKILPILKYSYDRLVDEHTKLCFLYCALFPEDHEIEKESLTNYWICEGFIGEHQVLKRAMNKGYSILGTLIRANLLTEAGTEVVVMHDVVREMAIWIASSFGKQKDNLVVQTRAGLREIPKVEDWRAVRRMSLMGNKIEEITCGSGCSELTTLFLQNNKLKTLSGEFIRSMQELVVLDLSNNYDFKKLPEQISKLTSLQYLDLTNTSIEQLPVGFQELKKLTHLDLTFTVKLRSVDGISKLTSLRILKLLFSNVHGDGSVLTEVQLLEHLQILSITIDAELGLKQILGDQRLAACINGLHIRVFEQKPFNLSLLMSMENLRVLMVDSTHVVEINTNLKYIESFTNLSTVEIIMCTGIKDLTWLLFAPNLVFLYIQDLEEVEEIINKEKETNLTGTITPFKKLRMLRFYNLPKLESIYWRPLPFSLLGEITAVNCPKLKKLPLNATSVPRLGGFMIDMRPLEHITNIEWENEDTKNRFLPLFL